MCGIAGIVDPESREPPAALLHRVQAMAAQLVANLIRLKEERFVPDRDRSFPGSDVQEGRAWRWDR